MKILKHHYTMPFIPLPILSITNTEEELSKLELLNKEPDVEEDEMWVNTSHITDFCEQNNGLVLIFLSSGRSYTILLALEEFLDALAEADIVVEMNKISDN